MIVSFNIEYRTNWGEVVCIFGLQSEPIPMQTTDGIRWDETVELDVPDEGITIEYSYLIKEKGIEIRKEWNSFPRRLFLSGKSKKRYIINDSWRNNPELSCFYSSAFTDILLARPHKKPIVSNWTKSIIIKTYSPTIDTNYCLAISGNQKALGNWDPEKALLMDDTDFPNWQIEIDAGKLKYPLEYKFLLYNKTNQKVECWEVNPNRYLSDPGLKSNDTFVASDRHARFNIPAWKGAGVAIPVFSLRTEKSFGVGDFGDLKKMVDWAVSTHQKTIQILPINDTNITMTWTDSYPYNSISIYAFHPMYMDLSQMGRLKDKAILAHFQKQQKELNSLSTVDYEAVNQAKQEYIRLIYEQEGKEILASDGFKTFFEANKEWLQPYAAFSYLRDAYKTADFHLWPRHAIYDKKEIEKMCQPQSSDYPHIAFYYYTQYNLHLQLSATASYARQQGVVLKGDIPIGISRDSVEAWTEPYYFNLDGQAGAPPDDFSVNGQNWGFPTYNWDAMAKDNYRWWTKRLQKMAEYFDAYRIDHILGFFRIWEIPTHAVTGLLGQFVPSIPMSREEIENFGLTFREDYLKPYIHESFLSELFGPYANEVKELYIKPIDSSADKYCMKPGFETQREVEKAFSGKNDEKSIWIKKGLFALISDVLFVQDNKEKDKYHPRISVQHDFIYKALNEQEKNAFNRLYDQYYYHRHNDFWKEEAMKKLPKLIDSTRMLACGEDLGMIPSCVPTVMNDLRILNLEIQRMPKNPSDEFGNLNDYPYRSVCTISTHDMSTLRGWWEENYQQTQRYYNTMLGHYGAAPATATPELCEEVVRDHLKSNSILCILSLQDWLSISNKWRNPNVNEERINVPANPHHYWRYRMHITIEQLLKAEKLNEKISELINYNGRDSKNAKINEDK